MRRLAVVGVGSPFGEDTLGWQAVDALTGTLDWPGWQVRYDKADRPGTRLLELFGDADAAVLLDALLAGDTPGRVRLVQPEELALLGDRTSSHALGVAEVLALGDRLGMLPERLWIIGLTPGELDPAGLAAVLNSLRPEGTDGPVARPFTRRD